MNVGKKEFTKGPNSQERQLIDVYFTKGRFLERM